METTSLRNSSNAINNNHILPWPTSTLTALPLLHVHNLPRADVSHHHNSYFLQAIHTNKIDTYQLRKWQVFNFFLEPFGLRSRDPLQGHANWPYYDPSSLTLSFDIETNGASKTELEQLRKQLRSEMLRWHPDQLRRVQWKSPLSEQEDECAKAVWGAIDDASKVCERCLRTL